jgi:hypothetical protein
MITMYLPTIDHPPWFCAVLLVIFIPVSIWHERHWRRTVADYADLRSQAGAADSQWPSADLKLMLSLQPWLVFMAAVLLAAMVVLGAAGLLIWPHKLPFFDGVINYYDRPYLAAMLTAGLAAIVGAVALAVDLWCSPWRDASGLIRRAVHAPQPKRDEFLTAALKVDPGVPEALG